MIATSPDAAAVSWSFSTVPISAVRAPYTCSSLDEVVEISEAYGFSGEVCARASSIETHEFHEGPNRLLGPRQHKHELEHGHDPSEKHSRHTASASVQAAWRCRRVKSNTGLRMLRCPGGAAEDSSPIAAQQVAIVSSSETSSLEKRQVLRVRAMH